MGEEYRNKEQTIGASTCLLESKWMKVQPAISEDTWTITSHSRLVGN